MTTKEAETEASAPGPEAVSVSPEASTRGPQALTAVSETGTTDPEIVTASLEAATADLQALAAVSETGTTDPEAVTASPEASNADPQALTAVSETGTAGLEAVTEASEADNKGLNLVQAKKMILILTELIQDLKKEVKHPSTMNFDMEFRRFRSNPVNDGDVSVELYGRVLRLREILEEGAHEEPILKYKLIEVRSQPLLFALKVIEELGAETKETNVVIRTALLTALICYEALRCHHLPDRQRPKFEEHEIYEPLTHVLLSYILLTNEHTELFKKFLKILGLLPVDYFNSKGVTPLYVAIKKNNLEIVDALIQQRANCLKVSQENDTALHAALDHPKILKYLVGHQHCIPECGSYNSKGYTAIHLAAISKQLYQFKLIADANALFLNETVRDGKKNCLHLAVEHESVEIVEAIFKKLERMFGYREYSKYVITSQEDENKNSPFHAALQGKNKDTIELFLRNGAFLSEKGKDGKTALKIIATHFNDASNILCDAFDASISISTTSGENTIDYGSFTDTKGTSQINVIEQIVQCGQSDLLLHPLIKSYLYLKWNYFLPLFYIIISVHAIFLITFNVLVANIFYYRDTTNGTVLTNQTSTGAVPWLQLLDWRYCTLITLMYAIITMLIVQELFTIYIKRRQWRHHFADRETWMRLVFLMLAIFLPVVLACVEPADWQRHAACAALLLGWLQAMFLLSRFPSWGNYVLMFGRVAVNLLKILASMLFVIIGFSFCFMIQYRSTPPFNGPVAAFFKTLVMMSSEFDYEDLFGEDHAKELRDTILVVRLLFGVFVVFVAIALMNFMTGAAVSDINELTVMAEVRRLEKQVQLLSTIEAIVYDGAYANMFKKVFRRGRYYKTITCSTTKVTKWNVISASVMEKDTELNKDLEGLYNNFCINTGTGFKISTRTTDEVYILEQSFKVRPSGKLNEDFVKIRRKKKWSEEKKKTYITKNKIEDLHDAFLDKPKGEEKLNKDWILNAIFRQKLSVNHLGDRFQELELDIEKCNSKIEKLILNQTQTSNSIKELMFQMNKMAKN